VPAKTGKGGWVQISMVRHCSQYSIHLTVLSIPQVVSFIIKPPHAQALILSLITQITEVRDPPTRPHGQRRDSAVSTGRRQPPRWGEGRQSLDPQNGVVPCPHPLGRGERRRRYSSLNYPWQCSSQATSRLRDLWANSEGRWGRMYAEATELSLPVCW